MAPRSDFNQVHDVLDQLHEAGVVNLDKSMRDMLGSKEALGRLSPGGEVATAVIAWDGYGVVIKEDGRLALLLKIDLSSAAQVVARRLSSPIHTATDARFRSKRIRSRPASG